MQQHQIVARKAHRSHPTTTQQRSGAKIAPNLLNREFSTRISEPEVGQRITYVGTAEGWLYLAVILDLYSRCVVGWAMGEQIDENLVEGAWQMALLNRQPSAGLLHHSVRAASTPVKITRNN